jgi:hypothetical protein
MSTSIIVIYMPYLNIHSETMARNCVTVKLVWQIFDSVPFFQSITTSSF